MSQSVIYTSVLILLLDSVSRANTLSLRLPSMTSFISTLNSHSTINRMDSLERRCKCKCEEKEEEDDNVKLLAIEKTINVPKIKVHDFGKDEEWNIAGKMSNIDLTDGYKSGTKFMISATTMNNMKDAAPYKSDGESEWKVAGKYDMDKSDWNFNDGNVGFDFSFN